MMSLHRALTMSLLASSSVLGIQAFAATNSVHIKTAPESVELKSQSCPDKRAVGDEFNERMLSKALAKFESEEALLTYIESNPCAERVHQNLLWVLDSKRELSQESTSGVLVGSLQPNRAIKPKIKTPMFFGETKVDDRLWGIKDTKASEVWSVTQGEGVTVAVIDTGVDRDHESLKGQLLINESETAGQAGSDDDKNGFIDDAYGWDFFGNKSESQDDQGHGSHVSGTIAGQMLQRNFFGMAPKAKILAVKTHNKSGESREDAVVKGILYAADRGAKVINCSWGGAPEAAEFSQILFDAISYANQKGALLVAAAGNDGSDNDRKATYPANYELPNILSVAASTSGQRLASFSNYGKKKVQISAPGQSIYSVKNSGGYAQESGTSMAAPHAAGAAALVLAKLMAEGDSDLSPQRVRQLLIENAKTDVSYLSKISNGALDVSFLIKP